jgi:hypothetical protein
MGTGRPDQVWQRPQRQSTVSQSERRPPIGPVLSSIATILAEWWLGFPVTEASDPEDRGSEPARLGGILRQAAEDEQ